MTERAELMMLDTGFCAPCSCDNVVNHAYPKTSRQDISLIDEANVELGCVDSEATKI